MKVEIKVTVSTDDGAISRSSANAMMMATDVENADPGVQKQDFLTQVEGLVRTVGENQVPALYAAVESVADEARQAAGQRQPEPAEQASRRLGEQLGKWRKAGEQPAQSVPAEVVE